MLLLSPIGRKATNAADPENARRAASERVISKPNDRSSTLAASGWRIAYSVTAACPSSVERNLWAGAYRSPPVSTYTAGEATMLRYQSASLPQAESTTLSRVVGS